MQTSSDVNIAIARLVENNKTLLLQGFYCHEILKCDCPGYFSQLEAIHVPIAGMYSIALLLK